MNKIFIISPVSIAGCLITKGFADAFKKLGYFVIEKDIRETKFEEIEKYKPDLILGYDYSYLMDSELTKSLYNNTDYTQIHYFADEPQSRFAFTDNPKAYDLLKSSKNAKVFIWDNKFLDAFKNSKYLPLAVNPSLYKSMFEGYEHKISFVGRPLTDKRQKILCELIKKYGEISIYAYKDHFARSIDEILDKKLLSKSEIEIYKSSYKGFLKTEKELAKVYNSTKINLNITEQGLDNINYRVFEVLASSGFLITDYMDDLQNLFEPGKELESYNTVDDLLDKIDFYLKNLNIAQAIARQGRKSVVNNHTFKIRTEKILKTINNK